MPPSDDFSDTPENSLTDNTLALKNKVEPLTAGLETPVLVNQTEAGGRFGEGVIRAALLISLGNVLTRIFGVGREVVLAGLAGTGAVTAAFVLADNVLTIFFDLLVSGAISSALVPVLSRYAAGTAP